jgi:hypothetical protein
MTSTLTHYFLPIAIGVLLLIGGFALFRQFARTARGDAKEESKFGARAGCGGVLAMLIGGTLALGVLITSPTPQERKRIIERALHTPPDQIKRIIIAPGFASTYEPLVRKPVIIEDEKQIEQIAKILDAATAANPNHPQAIWTAHIAISTDKDLRTFAVTPTENGQGTLVYIGSKEFGDGWSLGTFRADGLEKLLESAATGARTKR